MSFRRSAFLAVLLLLTATRMWFTAIFEVNGSEAYFWMCAQRLDFGFFDGPAGTALLARAGMELFGDHAFCLRVFFPILAAACTVATGVLANRWVGQCAAWWAMALLNCLPAFNEIATTVNPVLPALTFATLGAVCVTARVAGIREWMACGIGFALAVQFSLTAILGFFALAIGCLSVRSFRRSPNGAFAVGLAFVLILAGMVPYLAWNIKNQWPILALGTWQTFTHFTLDSWYHSLGTAGASLSWVGVFMFVVAIAFTVDHARHSRSLRTAAIAGSVCSVLWLYSAGVGFPSAFLLIFAAILLLGPASQISQSWPRPLGIGLITGIVASALVLHVYPILNQSASIPWKEIRTELEAAANAAENATGKKVFVIAETTDMTALLAWHAAHLESGSKLEVFRKESQNLSDQLGLWPSYDDFVETKTAPDELFEEMRAVNPFLGRSALYLTREATDDLPQTIQSAFESVQPVAEIRAGDNLTLHLYFCRNYLTLPL